MPPTGDNDQAPTILLVGASRGLGHAMAAEFLDRGWNVIGTVRATTTRTELHELADRYPDRLEIEQLDIDEPAQIAGLRERLAGRTLAMLFVNAGTTLHEDTPIGNVPTDDFVAVMTTNALSPMRVVEALHDVVSPTGLIGAMTSGQGSITNNTTGSRELYRASKAALNMFMRSVAARGPGTGHAFVLLAPGWVRTALGGDGATYTIAETAPLLVDVLVEKQARPGLEFLDRNGRIVPW